MCNVTGLADRYSKETLCISIWLSERWESLRDLILGEEIGTSQRKNWFPWKRCHTSLITYPTSIKDETKQTNKTSEINGSKWMGPHLNWDYLDIHITDSLNFQDSIQIHFKTLKFDLCVWGGGHWISLSNCGCFKQISFFSEFYYCFFTIDLAF